MSHAQAFHTSCRVGLGGTSGFQVSAATPGLDREQLAAMSSAHARYEPAPDAPYEPTPEEMREFPVALRMSHIQGVGPVVSRTEYVGREYRGRNGAPDEGRFGNYFCHMVVGNSEADPFDGLMAVELWDAPHWTTTDAADTTLAMLGTLSPGRTDLATAVEAVTAAPEGVGEVLIDGALTAIEGGAPLLVVDPVADRAVTWIAWIAYTLPPHLARSLTFSTYEARPQDVLGLHVVATLPSCDGGATITGRLTRVDVTKAPQQAATPSLYARVATTLAAEGPEALASAARTVRTNGTARQGADLAIAGKLTELITEEDLAVLLEQILAMVRSGRSADAALAVAAIPESLTCDRDAIALWAELYAEARRSTSGDAARELATTSLGWLVNHLEEMPDPLPAIPKDAPGAPGVGGIGAWLRATEAAQGTDASGRLILWGIQLRLIGLNVPVDNRVGAVIAHDLERATMVEALDAIDADGTIDHVMKHVADAIAAEPPEQRRTRLLLLARYETARQTIRRRAEELGTFDAHADWQRLRVALDPRDRPGAALALARIADSSDAEADIRELWGPKGPQTQQEMNELLRAYLDAGRPVPEADSDRAFRMLMDDPLPTRRPKRSHIGWTLAELPRETCSRTDYQAWLAAVGARERSGSLVSWQRRAVFALGDRDRLVPDDRWEELVAVVGQALAAQRRSSDFVEMLQGFQRSGFEQVCEAIGKAIAVELAKTSGKPALAAREFDYWLRIPIRDVVDLVLPAAFRRLSVKDIEEVAQIVSPPAVSRWEDWTARNPRSGGRAAVARVFRRRKDKGAEAR